MAGNYKRGHDCKTDAEIRELIPESNHVRNSNYCKFCGHAGGSSIGNHTYSQRFHYHWWHCRNCGRDYDLIIQEYITPLTGKTPLGGGRKSRKKG